MTDWTTARVVRDGKGRLRTDDGPIRGLVGDGLVSAESAAAYEHMLGPLTPVLDADGLPVVRTVGDLTARHIGRRVRVDATPDAYRIVEGMLTHLCALEDEIVLTIADDESVATLECTLATPCEVLDA